jgi:hypothetical protein
MIDPKHEIQFNLENLYNKHQLLPVLREEFHEIALKYPDKDRHGFITDMLAQICLHRQADPPTLVGILSPKHGSPQEVADLLLLMCEFDYIDFKEGEGGDDKGVFMVKYDVSEDIQAMLDRYQYPLPMIVEPNKILDNFTTGYHTIQGSVVLNGSSYFLDKDMCLDHLDRMNKVPLVLDYAVIESTEGKYIKPTRKEGENFNDYRKRLKQASVFYNVSIEVMEGISNLSDVMYLTHKYDRRGRCYASGYHVHTQGTDYNKAVIQLKNKEMLT